LKTVIAASDTVANTQRIQISKTLVDIVCYKNFLSYLL